MHAIGQTKAPPSVLSPSFFLTISLRSDISRSFITWVVSLDTFLTGLTLAFRLALIGEKNLRLSSGRSPSCHNKDQWYVVLSHH